MFRSLGNSLVTRPLHCITSRTSFSPPPTPPPQSPMLWQAVNSLMDYLFTLLQTEDVKSQIMEVIKAVILQRETARSHLNYTDCIFILFNAILLIFLFVQCSTHNKYNLTSFKEQNMNYDLPYFTNQVKIKKNLKGSLTYKCQ